MKLKIRDVLLGIAIPLILCIVATIAFFTARIQSTAKDVESIYYDTLFQIDTLLINGDRDLYQALYAEQEYYYNRDTLDDAAKQELAKDYTDNNGQVSDRVEKANNIAKQQEDLYMFADEGGVTFKKHYEDFTSGFAAWRKIYDPATGQGDFAASMSGFDGIRDNLDAMQEISEAWAEGAQLEVQKATQATVISGICIFGIISLLLLGFSIFMIRMVMKDMKTIDGSIKRLSDGDFANEINSKFTVADFGAISVLLETMRKKLQDAILQVKNNAKRVNTGAEEAKDQIADSKKTTNDINQAVSDLATGATVLANEVQGATSVTANIGGSIDTIFDTSKANQDRGQILYDNSVRVKGQLEELKKADEMTDSMALEVTNSVNETAEVVSQISMAADAIINIASETNLLALNASIEAARAGEVGKGFAVVADNIKSLAEESNKSANEITEMLSKITALSDKNKELTSKIKEATNNENVALLEMQASFDEMLETLKATEVGNREIAEQVQSLTKDKNTILETI
ncbi:MAG: methyl-accepting chemotaxis protein, partial [Lachnospiraceae bacterium]|nr:methyl-accepting chemotaxis protein [Lachnospiraceae bacterium]